MSKSNESSAPEALDAVDPRGLLAEWANSGDEWVRLLVSEVIAEGGPVGTTVIERAYNLLRQEEALDDRTLPVVEELSTEARHDESAPPLSVVRMSEIIGVNALVTGSVIEPHDGLTILYGENGTGKTGYTRILKALADSRTADEILGNVDSEDEQSQAALIEYRVGDQTKTLTWAGERAVRPFTRMSIFDSPSVTTHVDEDLDYVYVPAALGLFKHVITAVQSVSTRIDETIRSLESSASTLLSRFPVDSSVYPLVEALGVSTDLVNLKAKASFDPNVEESLGVLRQEVAALESNTLAAHVTARKREQRVLEQALQAAQTLAGMDPSTYNQTLRSRAQLSADYEALRKELFSAPDLPPDPDGTWHAFIAAGDEYRQHLVGIDAHPADQCLYCRQALTDSASDLLAKYSTYLADKISSDIRDADGNLAVTSRSIASIPGEEAASFIDEHAHREDKPDFFSAVRDIEKVRASVAAATDSRSPIETDLSLVSVHAAALKKALSKAQGDVQSLEGQLRDRKTVLAGKRVELAECEAAAELARSWSAIEAQVRDAKEANRLKALKSAIPKLSRSVTDVSKVASDQLINQSFDALFLEECESLRAPLLKVQFVGREGTAHRRKVLSGRHKPSKVLSEGEQKVLALADFLAEARLAGITAPVIFDDPVSSLDHRRINEVAQRIAKLSDANQVIVFTHDIFFATTLLALSEKSKRCSYYQLTDEGGKGKVTRATGPRWDTLSGIKAKINGTIQSANQEEGEERAALVRTGYDWIRAWCEVFAETELLRGVTQRYQPNVGMTKLTQINTEKLADIIPRVISVFEDACRYIDGHSQPLPSLSVSPTLAGLEGHWKELQNCKRINDGKEPSA